MGPESPDALTLHSIWSLAILLGVFALALQHCVQKKLFDTSSFSEVDGVAKVMFVSGRLPHMFVWQGTTFRFFYTCEQIRH